MDYKDYYKIMGVSKTASDDDIKRAYRKLARKYHPDVSKEKDAESQFKDINEAYEVLKDPDKRKSYDQLGADWKNGGGQSGFGGFQPGAGQAGDFSEFFEQFFGGNRGGFGRGATPPVRTGEDLQTTVQISLEEAFSGTSKTIQYEAINAHGERSPKAINVKIPAGVVAGQQMRLSGQGGPGAQGGKAGDLYLKIDVAPHPLYRVEGRDLYLNVPIAPWEAALGATVTVPTLAGAVDVKIPIGAKSGALMRLKGRGLSGKTVGDQYLVLQIQIPLVTNAAQLALYEQMATLFDFDHRRHFDVTQ